MPAYHAILAKVTDRFSMEKLDETREMVQSQIATRDFTTVVQVLDALGIPMADEARAVVAMLPRGIQGALLGLVHENFDRATPFQIQFAWEPSYEYKLTIHEAFATTVSEGGVTVIIGTRYPSDPSPGFPVDDGSTLG